jgi:predicted dienelactone hydrolase
MNYIKFFSSVVMILCLLAGCSPASPAVTEAPAATEAMPTATPEPMDFPLSDRGPYAVGRQQFTFIDNARNDRSVAVSVWYPAVRPEGWALGRLVIDGEPDPQEAPYPLILSSSKMAKILAPYLVSHGFAWASVDGIDSYLTLWEGAIDQPLDILFALRQMADNPPEGLEGVINADNAGTIGYSFDGFNSLAMSGARIDAEYYRSQCPTPDTTTGPILGSLSAFSCEPAKDWDAFSAHFDEAITTSDDGLWQPLTDPRIRAVMPMASEGWWLFGERGLAAVDRPVLMIVATRDELYKENVLIFKHLGVGDKRLISFIGRDHMMYRDEEIIARMAHFATAFFGYYLKGDQDAAQYISQDFVAQFRDLAWGEWSE